jgi:hypothetical protein
MGQLPLIHMSNSTSSQQPSNLIGNSREELINSILGTPEAQNLKLTRGDLEKSIDVPLSYGYSENVNIALACAIIKKENEIKAEKEKLSKLTIKYENSKELLQGFITDDV